MSCNIRKSVYGCICSVLSYVDLWRLSEVEFFVGGLLHKVETGVFKHEFHEFCERLFHEHAFAEQFSVVYG